MAAAPAAGGRGAAPALQAPGTQGEPARGAGGARPWDRDWDAVSAPLQERGLPPAVGGVWVAELGLLRDHQGDEEPALRCRAPPEGRGEPGGAAGSWATTEDHQRVLRAVVLGRVAQQGANVANFPGGGGGAPHHRCGGQQLAPAGSAHRPHPLALPPAEPTAAAAPASPQVVTQVTAASRRSWRGAQGNGEGGVPRDTPPTGPGPPTKGAPTNPPTVRRGGAPQPANR